MKYAIVAAALAGMAMAIPSGEWDPIKCEKEVKTYTSKVCGTKTADWDNCKDVEYTKTEYPESCPTEKPVCKGGKYPDGKECHDDDDDWSNWPNNCKWGKDKEGKDCKTDKETWAPYPTPAPKKDDWAPAPVKDEKCYTTETKVYTTKECGSDYAKWDNCKDVTKTDYYTKTTECKDYVKVTPTASWTAWETYKCPAETKVYTTKECGADKDKWDNCKDVTKTKTEYPTYCPTTKKVEETTWATYAPPAKTPAAVTSEWNTWKASSTVAAPVAKWTGAADKQAVGFGALAIAAVAALL